MKVSKLREKHNYTTVSSPVNSGQRKSFKAKMPDIKPKPKPIAVKYEEMKGIEKVSPRGSGRR